MFRETQMWDSVPTVIPLVEKIIAGVMASVQAESGKHTTIKLFLHIVPSQMVSKKIFLYFYLTYLIFLYLLLFLHFSPFSDDIKS